MSEVDVARKQWVEQRPRYEAYADVVKARLVLALKRSGFWYEVSARAKEIDSLVKKLLAKQDHTFASLPDKVGARVVVRFRADIAAAVAAIRGALKCPGEADDKQQDLGIDKVGYQSVHLDFVTLRDDDFKSAEFPASSFWVELQVRTLAQHLWSEMSHDTIYKNDETVSALPQDIRRRVNLMAGQIEVADREFDRLNGELPQDAHVQLLKALERYYYALTSRRPDTELSLKIIGVLAPTYKVPVGEIAPRLQDFLSANQSSLEEIYEKAEGLGAANVSELLFQPEALLLYERLVNDPIGAHRAWNTAFPEPELERIANAFGMSIH